LAKKKMERSVGDMTGSLAWYVKKNIIFVMASFSMSGVVHTHTGDQNTCNQDSIHKIHISAKTKKQDTRKKNVMIYSK
jgi:hypothetical protein